MCLNNFYYMCTSINFESNALSLYLIGICYTLQCQIVSTFKEVPIPRTYVNSCYMSTAAISGYATGHTCISLNFLIISLSSSSTFSDSCLECISVVSDPTPSIRRAKTSSIFSLVITDVCTKQ